MQPCQLPRLIALFLGEAFLRQNDRKRESQVSINTDCTLPDGEPRARIIHNGCRENQELARCPHADSLESRPGANLDSRMAQSVDCSACYGVLNARGHHAREIVLIPNKCARGLRFECRYSVLRRHEGTEDKNRDRDCNGTLHWPCTNSDPARFDTGPSETTAAHSHDL